MRKNLLLICFGTLIMVLTMGCSPDKQLAYEKNDTTNGIFESDTNIFYDFEPGEWQDAYIKILCDFLMDNSENDTYYSLRDLNNDYIPELILYKKDDDEATVTSLTVYSFGDYVYEMGEYKLSGAGGLHLSDNPNYCGLFHVSWGGGVENYWYFSIVDDKLVSENVLCINRFGEQLELSYFSSDNILIDETLRVYESDSYPDNVLDMYLISQENIINTRE